MESKIESEHTRDFLKILENPLDDNHPAKAKANDRINIDPDDVKNGLGQLVLTLVRLIHELLERQALRRIDAGSLNPDQVESVGLALMQQAQEIDRLRKEFNLDEEDLNLDLGPLGRLI